ncbi:hypothetical protein HGRIS_014807 [Hohenbuehelia grisea]|uniref:Mug135-like C-terminal domain-containing protein n=1 Tax=Hohenbuehelia grisea TaxID=104357 RepID=A0ABR3IQU3_9AGAR
MSTTTTTKQQVLTMSPISLPVLSQDFLNVFKLPNPPADPPTVADAAASCILAFQTTKMRMNAEFTVTDEDIVRTQQYKTKIMAAYERGELARSEATTTRALAPLNSSITETETKLNDLVKEVRAARRTSALLWNRTHGITSDARLEVVPFPDGSEPTKEPYNLPAITSTGMVSTLEYEQKVTYFKNYYGDCAIPPAARLNDRIIEAIGVKLSESA